MRIQFSEAISLGLIEAGTGISTRAAKGRFSEAISLGLIEA